MAYTTVPTITTGDVATAAWGNLYIKANFAITAPAVMTTLGDIIYASGANEPARLAKSATTTQYLANTGTSNIPAWNEVALATGVSGTLPVANGGTGVTSLTDKAVLISQDSGTDTVGVVDLTTSGELVIGGSSGPVGATITAGSGITISNGDGTIEIAAGAAAHTVVSHSDTTATGGNLNTLVGGGATTLHVHTIADDSIVEAKLDVSNGPTNDYFLQAQSGEGGGLTWAVAGPHVEAKVTPVEQETTLTWTTAFSASPAVVGSNLSSAESQTVLVVKSRSTTGAVVKSPGDSMVSMVIATELT